MTDFLKTFEAIGGATARQLLLFAALIVPGFISLRVYEIRVGGEHRKANEVLVDVVVYSAVTDLVAFAAYLAIQRFVPISARTAVEIVAALPVFVAVPVVIGLVWYDVRGWFERRRSKPEDASDQPMRSVHPYLQHAAALGAIVTLRNGRRFGAHITKPASLDFSADDVFLSEVWTLDDNCARLASPVPDTAGIFVRKTEYETIELLRWPDRSPGEPQSSAGKE